MSDSVFFFFAFTFPCGQHQGFGTPLVHRFGFIIEVLTEYLPAGAAVKYSSAVDREWHGRTPLYSLSLVKIGLNETRSSPDSRQERWHVFAAWLQVPPPPGFSAFLDLCSLHS